MSRQNDLLIRVVERYNYHKNYSTDDPFLKGIAEQMCEIEVNEMWMLTQQSGLRGKRKVNKCLNDDLKQDGGGGTGQDKDATTLLRKDAAKKVNHRKIKI